MLKPFPVNRLTASRRRRSASKQCRLRLAVKRFAHLHLCVLSALQSGAVQLVIVPFYAFHVDQCQFGTEIDSLGLEAYTCLIRSSAKLPECFSFHGELT